MLLFNTFPQFLCGYFTEFKFLTLQKMIIKWASVTFRRTIFIWKKIFARLKNFEQTRICKLLLWIISIWVHFSLNLLFKSSSKCYFFVFACLSMTISVGVTSYLSLINWPIRIYICAYYFRGNQMIKTMTRGFVYI